LHKPSINSERNSGNRIFLPSDLPLSRVTRIPYPVDNGPTANVPSHQGSEEGACVGVHLAPVRAAPGRELVRLYVHTDRPLPEVFGVLFERCRSSKPLFMGIGTRWICNPVRLFSPKSSA